MYLKFNSHHFTWWRKINSDYSGAPQFKLQKLPHLIKRLSIRKKSLEMGVSEAVDSLWSCEMDLTALTRLWKMENNAVKEEKNSFRFVDNRKNQFTTYQASVCVCMSGNWKVISEEYNKKQINFDDFFEEPMIYSINI